MGTKKNFITLEEMQIREENFRKNHKIIYFLRNIYYTIYRNINELFYIPKTIKYFFQRGRRGWANVDAWDFFSYHSRITRDCLRKLKRGISHPTTMTHEEWNKKLDKMIEAFNRACIISEKPVVPTKKELKKMKE